ncbi:hypothetical protein AAC387_Pa04g2684 [Persea americana]
MENADVFGSSTAPLTWHDFLERMRHPSAAEFVKSIKSFIVSFSNHAPDPERDSAAVQEFLANMERAFRAHSLWAGCSEEELDSAGEGLEKYVMTKLFTRAFASLPEDVKRDEQLSEKMALVQQFIRPEYLDIKPSLQNETSWLLAQKELQKINMYKAPRDKLVCILNCCKVINNLLLNASIASNENPPGADEFLPVLIYVTIKANPPQLHSNLLYIQRYRRQSRLVSEAAYFFTNILSAESFIWSIDAKSLSMDENEFEGNMESARAVLSGMSTNLETLLSQSNQDIGRLSTPEPKEPKPQPLKAKKERHDSHLPSRASSLKAQIKYPDEPENQSMARKPSISDLEYKGASELLKEDGSSSFLQEFPFLYANVGDLTLNEVEELLNSYKQLVIKYVSLSKGMGFHPPPLHVPAMQTESKTNNEPENTTEMKVSNEKDEDIKKTDGKSDATPDIDVGNLELKLPQQPPEEPVTISGVEKEDNCFQWNCKSRFLRYPLLLATTEVQHIMQEVTDFEDNPIASAKQKKRSASNSSSISTKKITLPLDLTSSFPLCISPPPPIFPSLLIYLPNTRNQKFTIFMGSKHQSVISFGPMFCLRPSPSCKGMVREFSDGISVYNKKCQVKEFRELTSPRVGCMGQIKRDKVVGFSSTKTNKFIKLKKIFSGKNLTPNMGAKYPDNCSASSIAEMGPPLPVPKRVIKECDAVSLWKRRRGQTLESLQLQHRCLSPNATAQSEECKFM